eukprot:GHUV01024963.1.p1 GENE.GHUV01024963.1~~GHUV01024963.1.p1  ORF type:complete len:214 (+),score=26.64 GHUV01024963.1:282-923(+)
MLCVWPVSSTVGPISQPTSHASAKCTQHQQHTPHACQYRVCLQLYEESLTDASGQYPGEFTDTFWQFVAPDGLRSTLNWISERYRRPEIWVTENGVASQGEATRSRRDLLRDINRLDFYRDHLDSLCTAVTKDNVNLAAYFAWTLMDNFEWTDGYRARYGIVHVDRGSPKLTRYPKLSAYWLSHHFFRYAPDSIACLEIRSCRSTRQSLLPVR